MNCRGASRRLSAYIDGQLSPAIKLSVEEHLKGCAECRQKLAEFEVIANVTHRLPSLKVSEGFADRVLAAAHSKQDTKEVFGKISYGFTLTSAAFMAAAAIVFFIIGPPADQADRSFTDNEVRSALEAPGQHEDLDIGDDPSVIVWSVPVPDDILARDKVLDDSLLLADSSSNIDRFILPEMDKGLKVNKEF